MHLKRLEIYGFKSFADKAALEFDQGITGIVGPNGSGKSNIADAVRWVLGEQSARQLRGGKMEDIIFTGAEKRKALPYCEVSLVFDNADGALPADYAEVMVTRRVYRSGEGEYFINKSSCRLKDIVDLFRDTGIGKEGYSLIGQGRIDEILSARSEERRNVFEEAAGIVKYKARKQEAQRRLERMEGDLVRIGDIMAELEAQLEPLGQKAAEARRYIRLYEALRAQELAAFVAQSDRLNERIARMRGQLEECAEILSALGGDEALFKDKLLTLNDDEAALEESARTLQARVLEGVRAHEAQAGRLSVEEERLRALQERIAALKAQREGMLERRGALEQADAEAQLNIKSAALERQRVLASEAEARVAALNARFADCEAALEKAKASMMDAMNRMVDVKSAAARLTAMMEGVEARAAAVRGEIEEHEARGLGLEEAIAEARAQKEASVRTLAELEAEADGHKTRSAGLLGKLEEGNLNIQRILGAQREAGSRLKMLERMHVDLEGYQHPVREALKRARGMEGGGGVHGVVASNFTAPKNLETALEMVLGASLQFIICDTEQDASRIIEVLRAEKLGRATFLPLSSVKGRQLTREERRSLSMPGCLGVASELIRYDETYRPIMENLLGRTVVAENLKCGIEIMRAVRNAYRLVTLDGDVINPGGAMTGGSVQTRAVNLLSRGREIEEYREALAKLDKRLDDARAQQTAVQSERDALKQTQEGLRERLRQQDIAVTRDEERLKRAEQDKAEYSKRLMALRDESGQLEEQLADARAQLKEIEARSTGEQQADSDARAGAAQLSKEVAGMREELDNAREALSSLKVHEAATEREVDGARRDLERLSRQKDAMERDAAVLETRIAEAEADATSACAAIEEHARLLSAAAVRQQALEREYEDVEHQRLGMRAAIQTAHNDLDGVRARADEEQQRGHRLELSVSRAEADLEQAAARVFSDYGVTYAGALEAVQSDGATYDAARAEELRAGIRELGTVSTQAIEEHRVVTERYTELVRQTGDIDKARGDLGEMIASLERRMEAQFKEQFALLNENFGSTFRRLFGGGVAQLRLTDERDALNCDIEITAQPPGKKLQLLSLLSGGERALTAIAVLFATLMLKPTPFCILDEIEAALDEHNIYAFGSFLREFARDTQFIVVTHRKGTMEHCNVMYGVSMEEKGVSKLVSVRLDGERAREVSA